MARAALTRCGAKRRCRPPLVLLPAAVVLLAFLRGLAWVSPKLVVKAARASPGTAALRGRVARAAGENFFERALRVGKANLNGIIQGMEDPEKILDQTVDDMQEDLVKVRQAYAEVLATQRRMQTQKEQADEISQEWYQRAELAVQKGDDELAKEALTRRQTSVDKAEDLGRQLAGIEANVDRLFDSVKMLEDKISQAKDEKEQLIARARTAKTTAKVNEMLSDVNGGDSGSVGAFERMKDKVEQLETKAEVSEGFLPAGATPGSVEDRFKALESGNKVEDELAKMKGAKALPSAGGIDSELEAMRKKLKESKD